MSNASLELGLRIRGLRNERKMSQEELAFKAGISPAHLGQIERATKNPTVDTVARIAYALSVPIAELFTSDTVTVPPQNATVEKINAHLGRMTEEEQRDVLRIIRILRNYHRKTDSISEPE